MKKIVTLFFLIPFFVFGQNTIYQDIQNEIALGKTFESVDLFIDAKPIDNSIVDRKVLEEGVIATLNHEALRTIWSDKPSHLTVQLPSSDGGIVEVQLMFHDIFTNDFVVRQSEDNSIINYQKGLHYKGIVNGDKNSIAAISIFYHEVMGLVSYDKHNLVVGKLGDRAMDHLIYDDQNLKVKNPFECGTPDDGYSYSIDEITYNDNTKDVGDCIRLYIEIDNDIVNQKGGASNATNYITGLFNQSIVLYNNEQLDMSINEIYAWTTTSPYSSSSSSGMLSDFQSSTGSFNGDLAHLVSYQASGGIAAGFNGICNSNPDNSKCFSSITSSYSQVPTYSWSVMVVTHEMGHLIGSRHTHACVWNGNNTAIDGCAGQTEGSCSLPGYPSGGGTLMSYCHLQSVGINFNNGFGSQPGNVIRNTVANANCLTPCGSGPSCDDGIQNGDETGVDCGGSNCPPCPTCSDGVQNGDETGVDCGGSCPPCPAAYCDSKGNNTNYEYIQSVSVGNLFNSSGNDGGYADYTSMSLSAAAGTSENVTLNPGFVSSSYNEYWRIWVDLNQDQDFDDSGELLFSGSGSSTVSGSISIPSSAATGNTRMRITMKYGGNPSPCETFTYGEVEDYTISITQGPTCFDGIQNGDETGVDCGGSCPPCPEYCDSKGNNTNYEYIQNVTVSGNFSNSSGNNNGYADFTNYTVNATAGSSLSISLSPGFAGSTYTERWRVWVDFNGDYDFNDSGELVFQSVTNGTVSGSFTVPSGAISGTTRMRVSMKYGAYPTPCETFTYGEVEDYSFNISGGTGIVGDPYGGNDLLSIRSNWDQIEHSLLQIHPVPASEFITIEALHLLEENTELVISNMYGQVISNQHVPSNTQQYFNRVDVSNYPAGMYIVLISQETQQISKRFIVVD